jgi:phosphoribosylformimino-5-aminoimidazole carboxamide ribotide isomerase
MQFRPCIDLHQGKVKQIVGATLTDSDNSADVNFESTHSPSYYSELYKKNSLRGGHIIKLGPGNDEAATEALNAWRGGLQIGGGVNDENGPSFIEAGASHVIVTSFVFKNGVIEYGNLKKLVAAVGKEHLVLDLSCKERDGEYYIVTDRWQNFTDTKLNAETLRDLASYCDEFLIHAASVEGKMGGADLKLVKLLGEASPIPTTYAGGIASIEDIQAVKEAGCGKIHITIGSALDIFGGSLSFDEVVELCK